MNKILVHWLIVNSDVSNNPTFQIYVEKIIILYLHSFILVYCPVNLTFDYWLWICADCTWTVEVHTKQSTLLQSQEKQLINVCFKMTNLYYYFLICVLQSLLSLEVYRLISNNRYRSIIDRFFRYSLSADYFCGLSAICRNSV